VDWTIVVSGAIAGLVGVVGAIIGARIAGDSARESVRLSIAAEADRVRLADKRQVYARYMAAFSNVLAAAKPPEEGGYGGANFTAVRLDALTQVNEVVLIAPQPVGKLAGRAIDRLDDYRQGKCDWKALADAVLKAYEAFRADLDDEAKPQGR
jgi:hypothetical protein